MKTHRFMFIATLVIVSAFLGFAGPVRAQQTERILSFTSHIQIHNDRTMTVRETITVICNQEQIKRGIYRVFPTKYTDRFGNTVRVTFEVLEVLKDGDVEQYHTENVSNGVKVYIGREEVFLEPGEYTYTLTYKTDRQLGFFDEFDELYWNVTGNEWEFEIERAQAIVELPEGAEALNTIAYTGYQGEQGADYVTDTDEHGNPTFTTTRTLNLNEGFTIAVSWPKGIVPEPTAREKLTYLFYDNQSACVAFAGVLVVLLYYTVVWLIVGKDPQKGIITPRTSPPEGFSPASMRFVMRMGYDHKTFIAAIVNMAVKGYLIIDDQDEELTLYLAKSADLRTLSKEEQKLAGKLFKRSSEVNVKRDNARMLNEAITALKKTLRLDSEKTYFVKNSGYLTPGILLTIATLAGMVFTANIIPIAGFMALWLSGWTIGCVVLVKMAINAWKTAFASGTEWTKKGGALGQTLFALPFLAGEIFGLGMFIYAVSPLAALLFLGLVLLNILFYQLLKAPTLQGRGIMDQIEGFKQYLLGSPEKSQELFEEFLPYAVAFDIEQTWSEHFADMLEAASQESGYSPAWYSGRSWDTLRMNRFTSDLNSSLSTAVSASTTGSSGSRSSSGSSGGGSSGGGGGGGGGGGW